MIQKMLILIFKTFYQNNKTQNKKDSYRESPGP